MSAESAHITLLVTVKAYPTISDHHGEAVCVAGIRTDVSPPQWVRLFPVPFRDLAPELRFEKYDLVRLQVRRGPDTRPESYVPNASSIQRVGRLDTRQGWLERRLLVEPLLQPSMCEVRRQQRATRMSLAVIRPAAITNLVVGPAKPQTLGQQGITNQQSLLMPSREALEELPYSFRYHYRCADPSCGGHRQSVLDWEIGQAYRSWRTRYRDEEVVLAMIRKKWLDEIAGPGKDTLLFVGNAHLHPDAFMVLGAFYPPVQAQGALF